MQVETRITVIETKQSRIDTVLERLTDLQSVQGQKTALNEAAIIAIRDRTDTFAEHMEKTSDRLTNKQETSETRLGKLESRADRQDTKWSIVQAIGAAAIIILLTVVAQHLPNFLH